MLHPYSTSYNRYTLSLKTQTLNIFKTSFFITGCAKKKKNGLELTQYAYDVVLMSIRRRFNVMGVEWTSKQRRLLTGDISKNVKKASNKIFVH